MKTLFDYNPTDSELKELFGFDKESNSMAYGFSIMNLPIVDYLKNTSGEERILDVALLLEHRGDIDSASKLWAKIPLVEEQYRGGFDNRIISVD